ncbi:hypothetical protein Tco_0730705 [Tanacetum coccineum]
MESIENGNSWVSVPQTAQENGTSVTKMSIPVTAEEKTNKKNDVKARSLLLMALPNEHQLTFSQYLDAKTITESLDSIFNRLQKIVSRLEILGVVISQEDLNSKFLSSLPPEWNTHVVVWMNKPEIETMSIDDLYNNFKIIEQKVKKSVGASSGAQNLAFMTAPSAISTNHVNTAMPAYEVITAKIPDNPNGSNLLHQDLEKIHEDDLEAMDLKWQLSLLSMRAKRYYQRTGKKIFINVNDQLLALKDLEKLLESQITDKSKNGLGYSDVPPPHPLIYNRPKKLDLSYSGLDEFKEPEFKGYGSEVSKKESNVVCDKKSDDSKENYDKSLIKKEASHNKNDTGFINSGCSRHMTGNIAYLSDFKEFDGGYVTFGGGAHGEEFLVQIINESAFQKHKKNLMQIMVTKSAAEESKQDGGCNTASPDVNTSSFKLNYVSPSVNTASSYDQDSPKDMFTIGAYLSDSSWVEAMQKELLQSNPTLDTCGVAYDYIDVKSSSTLLIGENLYLRWRVADEYFKVTLKTSHLLAVKRIFRYLKGKPTLGLRYSKDSPFELVAYTDSDYAGATQDRKSTTELVGYRQLVLWSSKSILDMDLLTKGFDAGRFQYLVSSIGMLNP